MGAWGYGIIQNDNAHDGIVGVAHNIEADVVDLGKTASELNAAKLAAATALLLQISPYSFDTKNPFHETLVASLKSNAAHFTQLPGNASDVLNSIISGKGSELAAREGEVDPEVDTALHSDENSKPKMQRVFSVIELDLLAHPASAAYLQQIIDQIVAEVDEMFGDEESVSDLSREGFYMGSFALLLVLPRAKVDPEKFNQWRGQFQSVWDSLEPMDDPDEKEFEDQYNRFLELAFQCGVRRYS